MDYRTSAKEQIELEDGYNRLEAVSTEAFANWVCAKINRYNHAYDVTGELQRLETIISLCAAGIEPETLKPAIRGRYEASLLTGYQKFQWMKPGAGDAKSSDYALSRMQEYSEELERFRKGGGT